MLSVADTIKLELGFSMMQEAVSVNLVVQFGIAQCVLSAHWGTLRALVNTDGRAPTPVGDAVGSAGLAHAV